MKNFIMIVLKNALNAILTNAGLMTMLHGSFNFHSADGWWNIGKATLSVVAAREVLVWGPIVMRWTTTNAEPNTTLVKMTNIPRLK